MITRGPGAEVRGSDFIYTLRNISYVTVSTNSGYCLALAYQYTWFYAYRCFPGSVADILDQAFGVKQVR